MKEPHLHKTMFADPITPALFGPHASRAERIGEEGERRGGFRVSAP